MCYTNVYSEQGLICFIREGPNLRKIYGKEELQGEALGHPSSAFEGARQAMVRGLLASLSGRFEEGMEGVIAASAIANLKLWPTSLPPNKGNDRP